MELSRVHKKVIEIFNIDPQKTTPKGWCLSPKECPFCGKANRHFGIRLNYDRGRYKNHLTYNCFKCREHGADFLLFKKLDMLSFIQDGEFVKQGEKLNLVNKIKLKREFKKSGLDLEVVTTRLPLGYKRTFSDKYLDSRGFEDWQYELYDVGRTTLLHKLKNYIIFSIRENGENKGYLARHVWSKQKIKDYETKTGKKILRYANEGGIEFEKLLFGIDEITDNTTTVILVEGGFDKTNVDKQLQLHLQEDIKCCCTFGKSLSEVQIEKLRIRGIKKIYLLYDNDAVSESKRYSDMLKAAFSIIKVCFISPDCKDDAGDFDYKTLMFHLETAQDPINFINSKLQKRKLIK